MSNLIYKLSVAKEESGMDLPERIEVITFYPEEVVGKIPGSALKTVLPSTLFNQMYKVEESVQEASPELKENMLSEIEAIRERCTILEALVKDLSIESSNEEVEDDSAIFEGLN